MFIKRFRTIIIFLLSLNLLIPFIVSACGVSMIDSETEVGWTYGNDSAEQSFINYKNGQENLIITRSFENSSQNTVWVIPIPAKPNTIKLDVLSEMPDFSGYSVHEKAVDNFKEIKDALLASQGYPIIIKAIIDHFRVLKTTSGLGLGSNTKSPGVWGSSREESIPLGVVIHEHLEKEGMVAEVLSATNSDSLYTYLTSKGLNVEKDSISVLQPYIGKEFSFVASWISPTTNSSNTKGLLMQFPADIIFYPLHPGSVYSGNGLPETITVVGHVTPKLYKNIKNKTSVDYYYSPSGTSLPEFFSTEKGFAFTKITVDAKPSQLTEDLYIVDLPPLKVMNEQLIGIYPIFYGFILMIILSFISTYLTFRILRIPYTRKTVYLSLASCLSIVGSIVGARIFLENKKINFICFFSLIFCILIGIAYLIFNGFVY